MGRTSRIGTGTRFPGFRTNEKAPPLIGKDGDGTGTIAADPLQQAEIISGRKPKVTGDDLSDFLLGQQVGEERMGLVVEVRPGAQRKRKGKGVSGFLQPIVIVLETESLPFIQPQDAGPVLADEDGQFSPHGPLLPPPSLSFRR